MNIHDIESGVFDWRNKYVHSPDLPYCFAKENVSIEKLPINSDHYKYCGSL